MSGLINKFYLLGLKIIAFFLCFSFFNETALAAVMINEFNSYGDTDWVEVYRTNDEDISLYLLKDEAGNSKSFSSEDCVAQFCTVDWSNKLNNSGDVIKLFLVSDQTNFLDQVAYGDKNNDLIAPASGQTAGRSQDGTGNWLLFCTPTKGASNNEAVPCSSPPAFSPSPSASPVSAATYKIGEVKDKNGNKLANVKIYIDGLYTNHYAPETFTFCDGCQVGGFGRHTIKLEKNGYEEWLDVREITAGNLYEVNPVMNALAISPSPLVNTSVSPSVTPTPKMATLAVSPSPLKPASPSPLPFLLPSAEALVSFSPLTEASRPAEVLGEETHFNKKLLLPFALIGLGLLFLGVAFGPGLFKELKERWYTHKQ